MVSVLHVEHENLISERFSIACPSQQLDCLFTCARVIHCQKLWYSIQKRNHVKLVRSYEYLFRGRLGLGRTGRIRTFLSGSGARTYCPVQSIQCPCSCEQGLGLPLLAEKLQRRVWCMEKLWHSLADRHTLPIYFNSTKKIKKQTTKIEQIFEW